MRTTASQYIKISYTNGYKPANTVIETVDLIKKYWSELSKQYSFQVYSMLV